MDARYSLSWMKLGERLKNLFRRQTPTAEELAAHAEAESVRDQIRENESVLRPQVDARLGGGDLTPPPPF
jgi:hypothetical protein